MKAPDLTSTLVAGIVGALALSLLIMVSDTENQERTLYAGLGFLVGITVQVVVRLTGVS